MNDTLNTILGWVTAGALALFGGAILWLHEWMRSLERNAYEDDND